MSVVDEIQGKAIIWASYTHDIQQIADALRDRFGPESVATYYGETPQDERQEIIKKFQDPENPLQFFVGHPRTGGYGITLTEAKTVVYYSNNYDLEIRLQSEDRAHRIGQTNKVTYIDLVTPGSFPSRDNSLNFILERPNFLYTPLDLPVNLHLFLNLTLELDFGISSSFD